MPTRLKTVDAAERLVCDVTDRAATDALAADVATRHASLDGILHLVGGWKPGWSDEVTDWLNARLVNTLLNVSEAFEAAAAGGARRAPRDREHHRRHARRAAVVGVRRREARRRVVARAAERAVGGHERPARSRSS